jgi:hypothetical protein
VVRILRFAMGACVLFCVTGISYAQVDRSGLTGTVTDSAGRLLARTQVTAVHNATRLRREAVTNSNGTYDVPELPVGIYTVSF